MVILYKSISVVII